MAMTNAERQARWRKREAKPANVDVSALLAMIDELHTARAINTTARHRLKVEVAKLVHANPQAGARAGSDLGAG